MSYDSNQLIPDLSDFSYRDQYNLHTMIFLLIDPPKVFILTFPVTFRPLNGSGRTFSWVTTHSKLLKFPLVLYSNPDLLAISTGTGYNGLFLFFIFQVGIMNGKILT